MLGLLALTLATLISFNQQRLMQESYKSTIHDEIELAATGTSQHVMEMISGRSFDEQSTPSKIYSAGFIPQGSGSFTSGESAEFGRYAEDGKCNLMEPYKTPACDDVDDLDGIRDAPIYARLSDGRRLMFKADVDVDYVTDPGSSTPSDTPTLHKRVQLTVRSEQPGVRNGALLTIQRVVSYDPIRADANMEAACGPIGVEGGECTSGSGTVTTTIPSP